MYSEQSLIKFRFNLIKLATNSTRALVYFIFTSSNYDPVNPQLVNSALFHPCISIVVLPDEPTVLDFNPELSAYTIRSFFVCKYSKHPAHRLSIVRLLILIECFIGCLTGGKLFHSSQYLHLLHTSVANRNRQF